MPHVIKTRLHITFNKLYTIPQDDHVTDTATQHFKTTLHIEIELHDTSRQRYILRYSYTTLQDNVTY